MRVKAQVAVHDPVNYGALYELLLESYRRYQQLREMLETARRDSRLLREVHNGIDNSAGILRALPVTDDRILHDLVTLRQAAAKVSQIYGEVPLSPDGDLHRLQDATVAESLRMLNSFKRYAEDQERNATSLVRQSRSSSLKGAARMTSESNALILHGINQLIRLQSQGLKLQSERMAYETRRGKSKARSHDKVDSGLKKGFREIAIGQDLPRF